MVDTQDLVSWYMLLAVNVKKASKWQATILEKCFIVKEVENYWNASLADVRLEKISG